MYLSAAFILISCILVFLFRNNLKQYVYRLIYGDYHINYLNLLFRKNGYLDANYYSKSDLYNQVSLIKKTLNNDFKKKTDEPLFFQNIEFGIGSRKLISLLGKPVSCDILDLNNRKVVSLEYYIQPNNVVDKYVFYFLDDVYYFGEFIFNKVTENVSNQVLDSIMTKYKCTTAENNELILQNSNGNNLIYKDLGFRVSVSYFNQNHNSVLELLAEQHVFKTKVKSSYAYQLDVQQLSF